MDASQFSVEVTPEFLPEQSDPEQGVWAYSYTVHIRNRGSVAAQLIARTSENYLEALRRLTGPAV